LAIAGDLIQFAEVFPDREIVASLMRQLTRSKELERKLHEAVRLARARLQTAKE